MLEGLQRFNVDLVASVDPVFHHIVSVAACQHVEHHFVYVILLRPTTSHLFFQLHFSVINGALLHLVHDRVVAEVLDHLGLVLSQGDHGEELEDAVPSDELNDVHLRAQIGL